MAAEQDLSNYKNNFKREIIESFKHILSRSENRAGNIQILMQKIENYIETVVENELEKQKIRFYEILNEQSRRDTEIVQQLQKYNEMANSEIKNMNNHYSKLAGEYEELRYNNALEEQELERNLRYIIGQKITNMGVVSEKLDHSRIQEYINRFILSRRSSNIPRLTAAEEDEIDAILLETNTEDLSLLDNLFEVVDSKAQEGELGEFLETNTEDLSQLDNLLEGTTKSEERELDKLLEKIGGDKM
jgi:hypothetical protein